MQCWTVLNWCSAGLKEFHLKIMPKICPFETSVLFLSHALSTRGISANPENAEKVRDWPTTTNAKEVRSFLCLASYHNRLIPKFPLMVCCLQKLVGPTFKETKKGKGQRKKGQLLNRITLRKEYSNGCQNTKRHFMHSKKPQ